MNKLLVMNAGSSSLKFKLFEENLNVICEGIVEKIGLEGSIISIKYQGEKTHIAFDCKDHRDAIETALELLKSMQIVKDINEINQIGHRVVQGGEIFKDSVIVDDEVLAQIEALKELAPLHNGANAEAIKVLKKLLPNSKNVAVFDTQFFANLPKESYIYPVPYEWYQNYGVRKYGFHGTSHKYVSEKTAEFLKLDYENSNIIVCHLGNGASVSAVKNGKAIQTSMGLTPLAGIMMGTRSGDIDPSIIGYMSEKLNKSAIEIVEILNKESGMLGISQISSDARDVENAANDGQEQAIFTQDLYATRIAETIGSYAVRLGGIDAIAFTAGLGENDALIREKIINNIGDFFKLEVDLEKNNVRGKEAIITKDSSAFPVIIMPTDEEFVIASETKKK